MALYNHRKIILGHGLKAMLCLALLAGPVFAQTAERPPTPAIATSGAPPASPVEEALEVELNGLAPSQNGCATTFVLTNRLASPLQKLSFELALFNDKNVVDRITTIDFGELPQGKTRVRKFNLPNVKCENVTRIIVNAAPVCEGPAADACLKMLKTGSQIGVRFEG